MRPVILGFLLLSLIRNGFSQIYQSDFSGRASCPAPYNAAVKSCGIVTGSYIPSVQQKQCICTQDPAFDTDIINCIMNWVNPAISNGGNGAELSTAEWYEVKFGCGDPPTSAANLTSSQLDCGSIWKVVNTCGGDGKDLEACICKYKFIWDSQIGAVGSANDCPTVIEQAGDLAMGGRVRAWQSFACGPAPWVHTSGTDTSDSTSKPVPTPSSAATSVRNKGIWYNTLGLVLAGMI